MITGTFTLPVVPLGMTGYGAAFIQLTGNGSSLSVQAVFKPVSGVAEITNAQCSID